jgi:hypothetical protein
MKSGTAGHAVARAIGAVIGKVTDKNISEVIGPLSTSSGDNKGAGLPIADRNDI